MTCRHKRTRCVVGAAQLDVCPRCDAELVREALGVEERDRVNGAPEYRLADARRTA